MKKSKSIKVELTVGLTCSYVQHKEVNKLINEGMINGNAYSLEVAGVDNYENNTTELHLIMSTEGTYEDNLDRIKEIHRKLEHLSKGTSMEYKGISLIPNKVEWN